jgi:hypothetical protein
VQRISYYDITLMLLIIFKRRQANPYYTVVTKIGFWLLYFSDPACTTARKELY